MIERNVGTADFKGSARPDPTASSTVLLALLVREQHQVLFAIRCKKLIKRLFRDAKSPRNTVLGP